jgi:hypothetical protein
LRWWDFRLTQREDYKIGQLRRVKEFDGYSLKPFVEKKAIFVHIPKCAGVAVSKSLFGGLGGGHNTMEDYTRLFTPSELSHFYIFTLVRNPWDRLVSAYFFLKNGGMTEADNNFYMENIINFESFEEFVINWVNKDNIWLGQHFRPQWSFIHDKRNKVTVDFIGKVENMDTDFKVVCQQLGVDIAIEKMNVSKRNNYQEYYTDKMKVIVSEVYDRDIKEFGYVF